MNERYSNVQFDYGNQAKYLQMISNQEGNYSFPNKSNSNTNLIMPSNNSNYNIDNLTSSIQATSINNYGVDFTSNNCRLMDIYASNNKFPIRQQTPNMDRSNISNRYPNLPNNIPNGGKYNPNMINNDQRLFSNNIGMNSMHPLQMVIGASNHSNNTTSNKGSIIGSPSLINKSIDPEMLISKKENQRPIPKSLNTPVFYNPSILKSVTQLQRDNELENPKWIVFPPVLQSATQLRQGKQHFVRNKNPENPITIDEELKRTLIDRISACLVSVNGKKETPDTILQYTDITPIESIYEIRKSRTFNRASICYKAFDTGTEQFVLFRRFPGSILQSAKDSQLLDRFRKVKHPGLISINHIFVTEAFEDNSTVFIMDYYPCSVTALQTHVSDVGKLIGFASPFNVKQQARPYSSSKKASDLNMLSEDKSWFYLIQIINVVRYVHNVLGMCIKIIDPSKILIQYPDRIRLNCFGLIDFLQADENLLLGVPIDDTSDLVALQARDLENLGQFMMCIICGTTLAIQEKDSSIAFDLLQRFYSNSLRNTVTKLIRSEFHSINEVAANTFAECYNHVTNMYTQIDYLEFNLMKELECGRLFRLVCKLATICERNELGMDSNWSDYGANYQLKLFRDFVFHQVDSSGAPFLDLAHIVTSLNKLDAGSTENVCLISRDGLNMFCVTFSDLKQVLDDSFEQLLSRKNESNLLECSTVISTSKRTFCQKNYLIETQMKKEEI